ncbi:M3 family metallopeptidase [Mangrovibrevibacter kandeliae]|nr:M3 family metallopeptidase [Aurantimonas sp. CSK15Z-1]
MTGEDARLLERTYTGFVRGGARLKGADRDRLAEIDTRLSSLGTQFAQNVLADERDWQMVVEEDGLAGLPTFAVSAMAEAARERGLDGHVLTLSRSIIVPFLTFADRRDLREVAFRAWTARGETGGETDNRAIMAEILQLRAEKARLLGYASFAAYKLEDQMAKTPDAVRTLLQAVWTKATARAGEDAVALQALAAASGDNATIAPWDWRYLAQKRRAAQYAIDEAVVKPFFQLERMIEAAFAVAGRLFGLRFEPLPDLVAWHPDVRAWRVTDGSGRERGLFLGDYFARSSKRSGAWMSALRGQHKLGEGQTPVIYNVMNFAKPAAGQAALLSLDDAHTLFHEFGHALHGLLSDVTWPSLAGTSVARDWVELPSQLFEHWLTVPEVLAEHAVHADTGEPLPQELMDKLLAARTFDSGFDTVEYAASALVDLAFHETAEAPADPLAREAEVLAELGMPAAIVMRHRSPHFAHIFSGDGYAAGYYSYLWSEVLDADAFEAFGEAGDAFHPETADKLMRHVYAAGNSQDAGSLYTLFRGRMPTIDALMRKRGLAG